jgi:hypothetical protein
MPELIRHQKHIDQYSLLDTHHSTLAIGGQASPVAGLTAVAVKLSTILQVPFFWFAKIYQH